VLNHPFMIIRLSSVPFPYIRMCTTRFKIIPNEAMTRKFHDEAVFAAISEGDAVHTERS